LAKEAITTIVVIAIIIIEQGIQQVHLISYL